MLVTHMINLNGQILPANELCRLGKQHNIAVVVDAAHSFAQLDFKLPALEADYVGSSLHKWLSAPLGNGLLAVKKDKIAGVWPLLGDVGSNKE
jgi:selenocysteine lyase/cysteine desulfurase